LKFHRALRILGLAITSGLLVCALATSADAAVQQASSTNWSGPEGRPLAIGSAPVTHAEASFTIPTLTCGPKTTQVVIWVGMDSKDERVTQAGVRGLCINGVEQWSGFFEAYPANPSMLPIPALSNLRSGESVWLRVDYRPDIARDAFVADFMIYPPNAPSQMVLKNFYSPSGAKQRARSECVVERTDTRLPVAKFTDLPMVCIGGTSDTQVFLPGNGLSQASSIKQLVNNHGKTLVSVTPMDSGSWVNFHWLAAQ